MEKEIPNRLEEILEANQRFANMAPVPNWLLNKTEISPGAKLCFALLIQYLQENECAVEQKILAEEMGVSLRQVQRYIKELSNHKLIDIKKSEINKYQILPQIQKHI